MVVLVVVDQFRADYPQMMSLFGITELFGALAYSCRVLMNGRAIARLSARR